jgi:hypothetical protein
MTRFHRRLVVVLLLSAALLAVNMVAVINGTAPFVPPLGMDLAGHADFDGARRCAPRGREPGFC